MQRFHLFSQCTVALVLLAGCGNHAADSSNNTTSGPVEVSDTTTTKSTSDPVEVSVADSTIDTTSGPVKVALADYSVTMPSSIAGPLVNLEFANVGSVAHEVDLAQIEPGTTVDQAKAFFTQQGASGPPLITDPGGATVIGPGNNLGYQRLLPPGTYAIFCSLPAGDKMSHTQHGMIAIFTVTSTQGGGLPAADLVVSLTDDAVTVPAITAGTHTIAVSNTGTKSHEVNIGGVPQGTDHNEAAAVDAWVEGGQAGPPSVAVDFVGGLKSIAPGVTVNLTIRFKSAYTYQFLDRDGTELQTLVDIP